MKMDFVNSKIIASSVTNKVSNSLPCYHYVESPIEKKKSRPTRPYFTPTKVVSTHQRDFIKSIKIIL